MESSIDELTALKPNSEPGASELSYQGINTPLYDANGDLQIGRMNEEIYGVELKEPLLWEKLESAQGVEAESAAHEIARINLVKSAREIHMDGTDKVLWSERFRDASIELYGSPERVQSVAILDRLITEIQSINITAPDGEELRQKLLDRYGEIAGRVDASTRSESEANNPLDSLVDEAAEIGQYLKEKFSNVFDLVDESKTYSPSEQAGAFDAAIRELAVHDPKWLQVKVKIDEDAGHLSVSSRNREDIYVSIGMNRPDASGLELKGLIAHEMMWHLGRGLSGWEKNDPMMASGFPKYEAFEEGGGVFSEIGVTGLVPTKHSDRYLDIALALGAIDGEIVPRSGLIELVAARNMLRAVQGRGEVTEDIFEKSMKAARIHVDRMYKGGIGDDSEAGRVGVFSKDVIYYDGALQMQEFERNRKEQGIDIAAAYEYLMEGKFVATNPIQSDHVHEKYGLTLAA